jgi:lysophospholipase L1-like esterase
MLGHRLGATVIMSVGYNDFSDQYAANMEAALAELSSAGVKHVLWATLHFSPAHLGYQTMNDAIAAAATHHPELAIVDWNAYASGHPEWFQSDQVHLTSDGPRALARLFHSSLVKLGIPARRP